MKHSKLIALTFALIAVASSEATLLDFNDPNNTGVSNYSGSFYWNGTGGGHYYAEQYYNDDTMAFDSVVTLKSFQLNSNPWEGYGYPNGQTVLVDFEAFDSSFNSLWKQTIDLTAYTSWNNWLTVNVDVANVKYLRDYSPANTHGTGFWPSIDNVVINEQRHGVPDSGSTAMLALGALVAVAGLKRASRKS